VPDLNDDARAALQFTPIAKELMNQIREQLPEGTHFGLLILVPGEPEGRVVAITTDRQTVAVAAAQWVMSALDTGQQRI
jgi:hypothetical protein